MDLIVSPIALLLPVILALSGARGLFPDLPVPASAKPFRATKFQSVAPTAKRDEGFTQKRLPGERSLIKDGLKLSFVAQYEVKARVLGVRHYVDAGPAGISPLDLAMGWGPASDPAIFNRMHVHLQDRYFNWSLDVSKNTPARSIEIHTANTHIIPADDDILNTLEDLGRGDMVSLQGYLVDVSDDGSWHWKTSRVRTDTGVGACEILYVTSVSKL